MVDIVIADELDSVEVPARGSGGWGLSKPKSAQFLSDSSSMISNNAVVMSYIGNHEINGDLWIKPEAEDGTIISWGDSSSFHFITVFLENNFLNIHRYYVDSLFVLQSEVEIETATWSQIHWINRIANSYAEFEVYVNGVSLVHDTELIVDIPPAFTMINSQVIVGASPDPRSYGSSFKGKMMGVSLNGYSRSEEYLTAFPVFDGSEFFGMPLYLERNFDKLITSSPTEVGKRAFVPYSNDFYIPQGLASTYEDRRAPVEENMVYMSMYHKDIDGDIGGNNSIVVEMNPAENYRVRRCFRFTSGPVYGHVPSMAYCAGYLYVGSENVVYKCELPEYDPTGGKYFDLNPIHEYSMLSSNLDYFNDTLWVASWGRYNTADRAFLLGYPINENGDIDIESGLWFIEDLNLEDVNVKLSHNSTLIMTGNTKIVGNRKQVNFEGQGSITQLGGSILLKNVRFNGLISPSIKGVNWSGSVNIIKSNAVLSNVVISNNKSEDSINFVNSNTKIEKIKIINALSDGIDIDFGSINFNSIFCETIGNDCLDTSGSAVQGKLLEGVKVSDKLISFGEGSIGKIEKVSANNVDIVAVSKDSSSLAIGELKAKNYKVLASSFTKKNFFGMASLSIGSCNQCLKVDPVILNGAGNTINIESQEIPGALTSKEVELLMYGGSYGRATIRQ